MPKFPATAAGGPPGSGRFRNYDITAAEAWKLGAAVVLAGAPAKLVECGADPALIVGFAQAEVLAGDLIGELAGKGFQCPVAVVGEDKKFWMSATSDPADANLNIAYGIVADGDGIWVVDFTDVVNTRVYVHKVDVDRKLVLVSVLAANRQIAP